MPLHVARDDISGARHRISCHEPPLHSIPVPRIVADLFPGRHRWTLAWVFAASVAAAFFETVGIASILPFMALVLNPAALASYPRLTRLLADMGVTTDRGALLAIGAATVAIVAFGNLAAIANLYVQQRFIGRLESRLSSTLFSGYLRREYAFHVHRDAPSLLKVLNADVRDVLDGFVTPVLNAASRTLMILFVLAVLLLQDPVVAMTVGAVLTAAYLLIFVLVRRAQRKLGLAYNQANEQRARLAQEGLGGIKELLVLGREGEYVTGFGRETDRAARMRARTVFVGQLPKYIIEPVAFGGILLATLALIAFAGSGTAQVVPILALYAFAGYRLLPAFQAIFYAAVSARFYLPAVRTLHADIVAVASAGEPAAMTPAAPEVHLRTALVLDHVTFAYDGQTTAALDGITLAIRPHESFGLVGRSGAGKTTVADLILGLHQPTSGKISVDGVALEGETLRAWRRRVGYVPQHVFLANSTVWENIAFGIPADRIDREAVRRAATLAQATEFIASLPQAFDTVVGERGVKLSGGQQQRLGIARALYHQPDVLVFDEATSALDGLTEDFVMSAIRTLVGEMTIILIAHRLRTVEACDRIVVLEAGRVAAEGTFDGLRESSPLFQRMLARSADADAT